MKKIVFIIAVAAFIAFTVPVQAVDWEGKGKGQAWTWTETNLSAGMFCKDGFKGYGMSATQDGEAGLKLKGEEKYIDQVKFKGKVNYSTGYDMYKEIPGGYMESWGEQSSTIKGKIKSH